MLATPLPVAPPAPPRCLDWLLFSIRLFRYAEDFAEDWQRDPRTGRVEWWDADVSDPACDATWHRTLRGTMEANTAAFEKVRGCFTATALVYLLSNHGVSCLVASRPMKHPSGDPKGTPWFQAPDACSAKII